MVVSGALSLEATYHGAFPPFPLSLFTPHASFMTCREDLGPANGLSYFTVKIVECMCLLFFFFWFFFYYSFLFCYVRQRHTAHEIQHAHTMFRYTTTGK